MLQRLITRARLTPRARQGRNGHAPLTGILKIPAALVSIVYRLPVVAVDSDQQAIERIIAKQDG